jgi:NADPH:quinone reductase-like Zn-dependent oxidoreductase
MRVETLKSAPKMIDMPAPIAKHNDVVVDIHAAGVGVWDAMLRDGAFPGGSQPPFTLGFEGTGVVSAIGGEVTTLAVGDRVMFFAYAYPNGAYAQQIVLDANIVAKMPTSLDFVHAAALPVAGITAWMALTELSHVSEGMTVLVTAAAGGVGMLAVQIANTHGAHVIGTGSAENEAFVRGLGVDEYVDYTHGDFVDAVRAAHPDGVDIVLECAASGNGDRGVHAVKTGGTYVDLVGLDVKAPDPSIRVKHVESTPSRKRLETLAQYVDNGALKVHVDKTFPLAHAADALAYVEQGHTFGKVVLTTT